MSIEPHPQTVTAPKVLRILHLEDAPTDHELVQLQLRRGKLACTLHRVDTEAQFRVALQQPWDVILSDHNLPGFSGLMALEIFKASGLLLPFIIVSGVIGEDAAVDAMRRGASDYLLKDKMARLVPAIERALQNSEAQRARLRSERALAESRQRLSELAQHLQSSVEQERAAISREIHDDVGGSLTALKFDLAWLAKLPLEPQAQQRVRRAQEMLDHALGASKRLMMNLRPALLDQGLVAAVQWLTQGFSDRTGLACRLHADPEANAVTPEVALVVFRTVQEALTNVTKHAQAHAVQVDLVVAAEVLSVEISDDGVGWSADDLNKVRSFGLRGLKERALTVGGWIDLSSPGQGASVMLSVPLTEAAAAQAAQAAEGEP